MQLHLPTPGTLPHLTPRHIPPLHRWPPARANSTRTTSKSRRSGPPCSSCRASQSQCCSSSPPSHSPRSSRLLPHTRSPHSSFPADCWVYVKMALWRHCVWMYHIHIMPLLPASPTGGTQPHRAPLAHTTRSMCCMIYSTTWGRCALSSSPKQLCCTLNQSSGQHQGPRSRPLHRWTGILSRTGQVSCQRMALTILLRVEPVDPDEGEHAKDSPAQNALIHAKGQPCAISVQALINLTEGSEHGHRVHAHTKFSVGPQAGAARI